MQKQLELEFADVLDKSFKIKLDDPKDGLEGVEVKAVMDDIIAKKVFTNRGQELVEVRGARTITTSVEELNLA